MAYPGVASASGARIVLLVVAALANLGSDMKAAA
jgi:hypothetical protein